MPGCFIVLFSTQMFDPPECSISEGGWPAAEWKSVMKDRGAGSHARVQAHLFTFTTA